MEVGMRACVLGIYMCVRMCVKVVVYIVYITVVVTRCTGNRCKHDVIVFHESDRNI